MGKRGQLKLSFGMIFSIILIIFFISFAFFAIKKFIGIGCSVEVGQFSDSLKSEIDKMWKGSQGSQEISLNLPKKIEKVCIVDFSRDSTGQNQDLFRDLRMGSYDEENLVFYPIGSGCGLDSLMLENIAISEITSSENPFCVKNSNGKVKLLLKKNFGESLVTITR